MDALETIENSVAQYLAGNALFNQYRDQWQYLYESYIGGPEYRNAQHLVKYAIETRGEYAARLNNTPLQNHCASIINVYNSFLFKLPPIRDLGAITDNPVTEQILKDADLEGRSFNSFMKDVTTYASIFGHAWVIVSKPNIGALTLADEIAAGVRPYLSIVTPLMMLDWRWQRDATGRYHLTYIKYIEEINGDIKTIKEWNTETVTTAVVDAKNKDLLEETVEINGLGKIPCVLAYNNRGVIRGIGVSDIADIADQQKYIYNLLSEIEQTIRLDSHPSLAKTENTLCSTGAGSIIQMPDDLDPGLKPYILQSSGANVSNILDTIDRTVAAIDKMANTGAVRTTETTSASGVAIQTEFQMLSAKLADKASAVELTEEGIWRLVFEYLGTINYDAEIKYPDSFNIRDENADLDYLIKARSSGVNNTLFQEEIDRQIVMMTVKDPVLAQEIVEYNQGFEPHTMVNMRTGETVTVTTPEQHEQLIARGFVNE